MAVKCCLCRAQSAFVELTYFVYPQYVTADILQLFLGKPLLTAVAILFWPNVVPNVPSSASVG